MPRMALIEINFKSTNSESTVKTVTIATRELFANYILFNNIATTEIVSKFHKMLDGSCNEDDILSPSDWTLMMNQYRMYLCYNAD